MAKTRAIAAALAATLLAGAGAARAETQTLTPVADATIDYLFGDANLGAQTAIEVGYLSDRHNRRALIRFDLAGVVPPDAVIDSAQLRLYLQLSDGADPAGFLAVLLSENWSEYGVTWNNQPSRDPPVVGVTMNAVAGYKEIDVTDIARAWHNAPHYGLELRGPESEPTYRRVFASRENGATPPQLVVTYHRQATTTPPPTRTPTRTPTAPPTLTPANCIELLANGGFENGDLFPWLGLGNARLGPGYNSAAAVLLLGQNNAVDSISQNVVIPAEASSARLDFRWQTTGGIDQPNDVLIVFALHQTGATELTTLHAMAPFGQWRQESLDVTAYAGRLAGIDFTAYADGAQPSTFAVDDVSLVACGVSTPTRTHTRSPTVTATRSPSTTPSTSATRTPTPTTTPTRTASPTPSGTGTATPRHTGTPTASLTPRPTETETPLPAATATATPTASATASPTHTPSASPPPSPTGTPTSVATPTASPTASDTVTVTLCAVEDSYVDQGNPAGNYGAATLLAVGYGAGPGEPFARRTLLRFDLSFVPRFSRVVGATLEAGLAVADGVALSDVGLYAVAGAWSEGTVTWLNQPYVIEPAAAVLPIDTAVPTIRAWEIRALAQDWVDGRIGNRGVELRGTEAPPIWRRGFESREGDTYCPRLVLEVVPSGPMETPPPTPVRTATPSPTPPCAHPDAAGDSFAAAAALAADGTSVEEYVCPSGDLDWWQFRAAAKQEISVALYDLPQAPAADYDLFLVGPGQQLLASSEQYGADRDESILYTTYADGDFRVLVRGKGVADWSPAHPYRLRAQTRFACFGADEAGSTVATAKVIQPGLAQLGIARPVEAVICPRGDTDVFRFDVPTGLVTVKAGLTELPADYNLYLFAPDATIQGMSEKTGLAEETIAVEAFNRPGTWWVQVQPAAWEQYHADAYRLDVNLSSPIDLTVRAIEATQSIQSLQNDVPLVSGKPTLVRVYADAAPQATSLVTAKLEGWRLGFGGPVQYLGALTSGPRTVANWARAHEQRLSLGNTINFFLPPTWRVPRLRLRAQVNPGPTVPETTVANNVAFADVSFAERAAMNIGLVSVRAGGIAPSLANSPSINAGIAWMRAVWPTERINLWNKAGGPIDGDRDYRFPGTGGCGSAWSELLADLKDLYDGWIGRPENARVFGIIDPSIPPGNGAGCGHRPGNAAAGMVGPGAGPLFAHEIGHNFGRRHAPCGVPDPDASYPVYRNPDGSPYANASIGEVGVNLLASGTLDPLRVLDLMSYCGPEWLSPYTWSGILANTPSPSGRAADNAPAPHLFAAGWLGEGTIRRLRPFWILPEPAGTHDEAGNGDYSLELRDDSGQALFVRRFDWRRDDPNTPDYFSEIVPFDARTRRVVFAYRGTVVHVVEVSANAPTVKVLAPNGGELWAGGGPRIIAWEASDADGDPLTARVSYSPDGGVTWQPLAVDLNVERLEIDSGDLPGSSQAMIKVIVSDGVNTVDDVSDVVFGVEGKAPQVAILGPPDSFVVDAGLPVLLDGLATDPEDGPLGDEALAWSSDRDGPLGTGASVVAEHLSVGRHLVTLTATDADGQQASAGVTVIVGESPACVGDCDGDTTVTVEELVRGVNIALGLQGVGECPSFDVNRDGEVSVDEVIRAVNAALSGCPNTGSP